MICPAPARSPGRGRAGRGRNMAQYFGLLLLGAGAYIILWREGMFRKNANLFLSAAAIAAAMLLRGLCMEHETLDYQNFLKGWVQFYRDNGGVSALGRSVGNYNVPYLYFLALISYSGVRDLYLIKLFSVLFDVLLAWGVLRLVRHTARSDNAGLMGFLITLLLPTVLLNGSYWGQCDSVYAAFALWSVALALERRPVGAVVCAALSFAFKLQAVFLLPVFLVFIFAGRVKWRHLLAFPLTYLLVAAPAVLAGRPFLDTLLLYVDQADTVGGGLNYNSSSIYAFLPYGAEVDTELLANLGIAAAFSFLILLYILCFVRRRRLDDTALLACAVLVSVAVPFLLPHMHDRYFFLADVLSLALALVCPPLFALPFLAGFASLLGYHAYLRMRYLLPMSYGAAALAAAVLLLCAYLVWLLCLRPPAHGKRR